MDNPRRRTPQGKDNVQTVDFKILNRSEEKTSSDKISNNNN